MKLHARTVKITIDGKKHTVPFEVHNMLNNQREAINYYMHVLLYGNQEALSKDYINEFAKFIEENVEELPARIESFKNVDKNC